MKTLPSIAVVTRETRLQGLLARWGTKGAARFRLQLAHEHEAGRPNAKRAAVKKSATTSATLAATATATAEFDDYELEDQTYRSSLDHVREQLDLGFPLTFVDRSFIPNYDFSRCVAVVVLGQDGLVANTAKYVGQVPIVAVNPDPARFDGVLLPYRIPQVRSAVQAVITGRARMRGVTLAEAELNDGQRMLAFNDFFLGCHGHASARYLIKVDGQTESQSSSGLIVSTGAGSTGWLSSMFNMMNGFARWLQADSRPAIQLPWEDRRLLWAVREPFVSRQSTAQLVAGMLEEGRELVVESLMPSRGLIFSDGIETDFVEFNSGTIARLRRAPQQAQLVVPG